MVKKHWPNKYRMVTLFKNFSDPFLFNAMMARGNLLVISALRKNDSNHFLLAPQVLIGTD